MYALPYLQLKHQLCPKQKQFLQPRQQRAAVRTPVMIQTRRRRRSQQRLAFLSSICNAHLTMTIASLTNRITGKLGSLVHEVPMLLQIQCKMTFCHLDWSQEKLIFCPAPVLVHIQVWSLLLSVDFFSFAKNDLIRVAIISLSFIYRCVFM